MQPIVLAYSGGPQSSQAIPWLAATYGTEVVALTLDIGQGGDLEQVRDRALAAGAVRAHVLDAHDEFARGCLLRALKARTLYRDGQPLAALLARPLIARRLVEIANIEQASIVAHAAPADQARMAAAVEALSPELKVVAAPGSACAAAPSQPPRALADCPSEAAYAEITFDGGVPTALNGIPMPLLDLIGSIDVLAGAHGVGCHAGLETPAARVLAFAHAQLDAAVITGEARRVADLASREYAAIIESGAWHGNVRVALDAFVDTLQRAVTGRVRLKLFKGECTLVDTQTSAPREGAARARQITYLAAVKA